MKRVVTGRGLLSYSSIPASQSASNVPIFLYHGIGFHADVWLPWYAHLWPEFPIIAIDVRGHGASADAWFDDLTFDDFVNDVESVLQAERFDTCHFVGESFGGTVGLAAAIRQPKLFTTLTVVSATFAGERIATLDEWPDLVAGGTWPHWMAIKRLGPAADAKCVDWVTQLNASASPVAVLGMAKLLRGTSLGARLGEIACPTLVVSPAGSPFLGSGIARELHAALDPAIAPELVFVEHASHGVVVSHPHACANHVRNFIERR
ncbi:MAG: alpha/beta hydrolase [Candidatus Velthaea sp.]